MNLFNNLEIKLCNKILKTILSSWKAKLVVLSQKNLISKSVTFFFYRRWKQKKRFSFKISLCTLLDFGSDVHFICLSVRLSVCLSRFQVPDIWSKSGRNYRTSLFDLKNIFEKKSGNRIHHCRKLSRRTNSKQTLKNIS